MEVSYLYLFVCFLVYRRDKQAITRMAENTICFSKHNLQNRRLNILKFCVVLTTKTSIDKR